MAELVGRMPTEDADRDNAIAPPKRVLAVDDDPILREVMAEQLSALGLETVGAENGEVGCTLIGRESFSLAIIDITMPKLDGFGLLRHIRQHPRSVDLPVIVVTSHDDPASIDRAYDLGASSFVTKPVNWPQFAHHVQFVVRSGEIERALRLAQAEALSASKMKNALFHILSHELKTPLTALIGLTDVVSASLRDRLEGRDAEHLQHVIAAAQRLNATVSDILVLSKALSGEDRHLFAAVTVCDLIEDSIVGLKAKAREREINLIVRPPERDLQVVCDWHLLHQAVHKLVDNAIKFSPAGGIVEIWAHGREDGAAVVCVRDRGPGLSAARLRQCLQPFVQDDMSYGRPAEGLGLGLPIAKSIVEAHGGELLLQSSPGQGLTASIWLPARRPAAAGEPASGLG
jgi:signal transduction histidine kinase